MPRHRERNALAFATLSVRLPRTLLAWVRGEARREDRSASNFVARALASLREQTIPRDSNVPRVITRRESRTSQH